MGRIAYQESAGGVIVSKGRVLLILTRTRGGVPVWTFPKGRLERNERQWEAALREVREETGFLCRLRRRLKATSYSFRSGTTQIRKTVHWFLLEPVRLAGIPNPDEVDDVRWFSLDEAGEKLSYRSDVGLLHAVREAVRRDASPSASEP